MGSQPLGTKERGAVWPRQIAVCPQLPKFCTGVSKKDRHREKVRAAWAGQFRRRHQGVGEFKVRERVEDGKPVLH